MSQNDHSDAGVSGGRGRGQGGGSSANPQLNVISNPVAAALSEAGTLPSGSFIITGGMYGSNHERILIHTGGLPSAPPSTTSSHQTPPPPLQPQQRQQLSPVFILPPQQQPTVAAPPPAAEPERRVRNMALATSDGHMLPSAPQKKPSPPTYSDDDDLGNTSISLPSFGGSFDCLSNNGNGRALHTPLLGSELPKMISRTPLPVIGGICSKALK